MSTTLQRTLFSFSVFFLFLIKINTSLYAQCTIQFTVVDAITGVPLEGAVVSLDNKKQSFVSDTKGRFKLTDLCVEHILKVTYVGYVPYNQKITFGENTDIKIELENKETQLEAAVITSQSTVRNTESPALGVNLLSLKAVKKLPAAAGEVDILRGLQMLPGVSAVGEGSNGVNIRGGNVDQNLIFLDNMPIFNPTHLLGMFSLFPTDAIREMQIYKGSIPARYGGRTSSVLDVKMIEPSTENFELKGGIGLISNRLNIETPIIKNKLSLLSSARFSYNEYLVKLYNAAFVSGSNRPIPNNHANFYDLANKILFKPTEKDNITFSSYLSHDKYEVDSLFQIVGVLANRSKIDYGHQNFSLRWNHYFNPNLNFNVLAVNSLYKTNTRVTEGAAASSLTNQIAYKNLKAEVTYLPNKRHRLNMGLTGIRYDISPGNLTPAAGSSVNQLDLQTEQGYELAAFASDEFEINDKMLLEGGLRFVNYMNLGAYNVSIYDETQPKTEKTIKSILNLGKGEVEQNYARVEPRLALRYKLNDQNSVKIGYNRMNQFLQIIANNTTPLPNARWKLSNRYIKPQESDLYTAGYFHDSKESFWEYSVEGYYRSIRNIFDYINGADLQLNTLIETQLLRGVGKSYGLEVLISKKKGIMTGWLSYTYARSLQQITGDFPALQQLNDGKWFPSNVDKPHSINALINFKPNKTHDFAFTFVYSTGRPYTTPVTYYRVINDFIPVYLDRNTSRIGDYHRLDFSWTITNPSMQDNRRFQSSWVFAVYNLYGHKNAYSYFIKPKGLGVQGYKLSVFAAPVASLTYNFIFQ